MKFQIKRTSSYDTKPIPEAIKGICEVWDTRTCTEEHFNKILDSGTWGE